MKNILVLVDFTEHSKHVAKYAFNAAVHYGADILLFNAYYVPNTVASADGGMFQPYTGDYQDYAEESYAKLKKLGEELLMTAGTSNQSNAPHIKYLNEFGRIGDNIKSVLLNNDIWFTVMGRKRKVFFDDLFAGSDSSQILRNAACPVMLIPDGVQFSPFNLITLASVSIDQQEINALNFLSDLIAATEAEIRIVHIKLKDNIPVARVEKINTGIFKENISFYIIEANSLEDTLLSYIENEGSDLLVLIHKEYGLLTGLLHNSLTKKVIANDLIPILVFNC